MKKERLNDLYFDWLCSIVLDNRKKERYSKVLKYLFDREFTYELEMDDNRAADGVDLRSDFLECNCIDYRKGMAQLRLGPCRILEMMVGLAHRCEEGIMGDDDYGDRTHVWFWKMMRSLGLDKYPNDDLPDDYIYDFHTIVNRFLDRKYRKDGKGGLFYIHGYAENMREIEIWYQLMAYLDTIDD